MNKKQKQIIAAILRIDATWGININNYDYDDEEDDDLHANTDNDANFQEKE